MGTFVHAYMLHIFWMTAACQSHSSVPSLMELGEKKLKWASCQFPFLDKYWYWNTTTINYKFQTLVSKRGEYRVLEDKGSAALVNHLLNVLLLSLWNSQNWTVHTCPWHHRKPTVLKIWLFVHPSNGGCSITPEVLKQSHRHASQLAIMRWTKQDYDSWKLHEKQLP